MKMRILFVDDQPRVLDGIRRLLRGHRHEWEMVFIESGRAALEVLANEKFDVIVSDMRMPGMDGAELLNQVRQRYPDTVRIILSGQSDQDAIQRSIGATHQYLSKPCDQAMLESVIARACSMRTRMSNEHLKRVISQIVTLPSPPRHYLALIDLLQSPDSSIQEVAELVSRDVAMTTKLLQLVNSSFFGLPQRVQSPAHAASLLGLKLLRPLVLGAGVFCQSESDALPEHSLEALFEHSIAVGRAAQQIAEDFAPNDLDLHQSTLLAGVVHDVGQVVLASNLPDEYAAILATSRELKIPLYEAELQHLGTDHACVGAYLLGLWGLPESVIDATAYHHQPELSLQDTFSPLTALHIANVLVNETQAYEETIVYSLAPNEEYLQRVGCNDRVGHWRELVSLSLSEKVTQ